MVLNQCETSLHALRDFIFADERICWNLGVLLVKDFKGIVKEFGHIFDLVLDWNPVLKLAFELVRVTAGGGKLGLLDLLLNLDGLYQSELISKSSHSQESSLEKWTVVRAWEIDGQVFYGFSVATRPKLSRNHCQKKQALRLYVLVLSELSFVKFLLGAGKNVEVFPLQTLEFLILQFD